MTEESFTAGTVEVFDLATRTQSSGTIDGAGTLKITAHNRGFSITPSRDSFILYGKTFNIELGTENPILANLEIENPIFPSKKVVKNFTLNYRATLYRTNNNSWRAASSVISYCSEL